MFDYCVANNDDQFLNWILANASDTKYSTFINRAMVQSSIAGLTNITKLCLENRADPNFDNNSAIQMAAKHGHLEIVRQLIQYGCNLDVENGYPLCWASKKRTCRRC